MAGSLVAVSLPAGDAPPLSPLSSPPFGPERAQHGITGALYRDLDDAGWAQRFAFKCGSSELLKSTHDPDGMHSWLEINGWAIDVANGANRPVIIMPKEDYYNMLHVTNVEDQRLRNG
jgi:hypothetical protein